MLSGKLIKFLGFIAALQFIFALFVFLILSQNNRIVHAVFGMGLGLFIFWIILFGLFTKKYKNKIRQIVLAININWQIKFVLFCTLLALLEEAITTGMTNLAPFFGTKIGEAYMTASANYLDVVLGHSVIMFVPIFIAWAYLLSKYDFKPNQVFLLFGLTGTIMEILFGGPQHIFEIGMWMFVYGLMVYLPAYCLPENRSIKPVKFYYLILPFIFAIIFQIILLPVVPIIKHLRPSVNNSFPPIQSK
jgi:hypothetical protein